MAGKLSIAAKCLLGTTLLSSGTGGVYYASSHGWNLPGHEQNAKQAAASDLDAVASAWAEPASHTAKNATSSPVARSAAEVPAKADVPAVKPASEDRYAVKVDAPAPVTVAKDEAKTETVNSQKSKAEPTATKGDDADKVKLASLAEVKSDDGEKSPTPVLPAPEPVARGQEPKDDAAIALQVKNGSSDIGGALDAVAGNGAQSKEPKPINTPDQQSNIADTAQRAKQAFGNQSSPAASDRYGSAAGRPPEPATLPKSGAVNPFDSKPFPPAQSNANSQNGLIQPLQSSPPSRAAMRNETPKNRTPQTMPVGNGPGTDLGPLPPTESTFAGVGSGPGQPLVVGDGTGKPGEKALEGPQQPTLLIQKFAPGEVQVGKPAKFVLQVKNVGAQAADNVTVHDELPQGTQLISTAPNASSEGNRLVWSLGKLSAGEDRTVEMQVMPKAEGEIGSVATVSYSAQASVKTRCTMPQLAIRMTAPSEVMVGNQQHVKIEVRNPGSGDATKVMLFENIPANMKHVAGPALEFEIGTLHPNETRELDLVLSAEKAGKVINTITARAEGSLQVQQQVEFEVIAPALSVAVQGPERRYLERPATYEVSVQNPGTAAAHDVQIVTKLPKGMRFVKANNMGEYDAATHAVYWSLAELPKGEKGTVELIAMPVETGPQTLQVESRAQQGLTDKTQREVLVEGLAAIKFEVRALEDPIEVGGESDYEIRIVNQGTKAATNVQIAAELPPGLKLISAEGETQHKVDQGRIVFAPLQQLAPKADTVYRFRAQGTQPGDQRIAVEVKTDDMEHPIRREESTRVFGDQ